MSRLRTALDDYVRIRRALGFKLERAGRLLPQFVAYLELSGAETITTDLALAWATLPQDAHPEWWAHRMSEVRGFARHLQALDPRTEVPVPCRKVDAATAWTLSRSPPGSPAAPTRPAL